MSLPMPHCHAATFVIVDRTIPSARYIAYERFFVSTAHGLSEMPEVVLSMVHGPQEEVLRSDASPDHLMTSFYEGVIRSFMPQQRGIIL